MNLKKYCFHQNEMQLLGYVVFLPKICIKDEQIKAVRDWPESQSVLDIQVFLRFGNFYERFIQDFSKLAAPFTLRLKITRVESLVNNPVFIDKYNTIDRVNGAKSRKNSQAKLANFKLLADISFRTGFLTSGTRLAFAKQRQLLIKMLILIISMQNVVFGLKLIHLAMLLVEL